MRRVMTAVLLTVFALSVQAQEPPHFNAGITRLLVPDEAGTMNTLVFYPTTVTEDAWQVGAITITASPGAPPVPGQRFPVVLISHGRHGGPLNHTDLAIALARAGFIAVLPTHMGDASGHPFDRTQPQVLMDRPRQAKEALDAVLASPRLADSVDGARIGMIGYSAGGYTALMLAGAKPDFARAIAACAQARDPGSCPHPATASAAQAMGADVPALQAWKFAPDRRIKALVLLDPLALMFDAAGLASIHVPTLIYRPQNDAYLNAALNVQVVISGLPKPPKVVEVPGNHFVFVEPCPPRIAAAEPLICQDAAGVDRAAIHRQMDDEITDFLRANL